MAQSKTLKTRGLYTDPNLLSEVPEGAFVTANNVVFDRKGMVEPRRGFAKYGSEFGLTDNRAKQLLSYKNRLLVHYETKLLFNDNPHESGTDGNFLEFSGDYSETEAGLRIKGIESNRNFYFTTSDGIKKISAQSADDLSTASDFIVDAGGIKALDVTGNINGSSTGFLPANSAVAYRVVWGYTDANDNLILGSPSSRLVIKNFSDNSTNVDLEFVIPNTVKEDIHFYQVYRTGIFTATAAIPLTDLDPGDEMNQIIEDFPTTAQLSANLVELTDITPEDFRAGGAPLYTNPNSGEGINQANEPPPKAKDITLYQNSVFYANIETRARKNLDLLSVQDIVDGDTFTITSTLGTETYTFKGQTEITNIDFSGYTGSIPADLNGKSFHINAASNIRKYYVWYDTTLTTQTLDFSSYVGTIPGDLDGKYCVVYTNTDRTYYIWFDSTGSVVDPGTTEDVLAGMIGIKIDTSGVATAAALTAQMKTDIDTQDVFNDFDTTDNSGSIDLDTDSFDSTGITAIENILLGFSYNISTPANLDPDPSDRFPIRVSVGRNITTKAEVADATAAALLDQDNAGDFTVSYTASAEDLTVETTNNGNVDDASDVDIANSFSISVTQQGDGEDSALNHVLLSAAASPAQQIDETARSIVNIVNKNSSSAVSAFYLSGSNDIPGQMLFESRDISTSEFYFNASDSDVGDSFNPSLPSSGDTVKGESESKPNRLFFSKLQQPEAVPLVNFIDVGPQDKAISRIIALRESLFILKEDGVYRLTGLDGNYTVDLFDESTRILAPDTAVVLNNQIFCLANNGIVTIADTGVVIKSDRLDNVIQGASTLSIVSTTSFGVSYETDRAYMLFVPENSTDTTATQVYRYRTDNDTWSRYDIEKTCGLVIDADDRLYLGPNDENFIEQERKDFSRTDYADRKFDLTIPVTGVNGTTITLSQSNIASVGDALVQTQYLTISKYNQILTKLDLDSSTESDYISSLQAVAGNNIRDKVTDLAQKLDADPGPDDTDYETTIAGFGTTFEDAQDAFNAVVDKMNLDTGIFQSNYPLSEGTTEFEDIILTAETNSLAVSVQYNLPLLEGPVELFKGIQSEVIYAPQTFGDPSVMKHVREGTVMFENNTFSRASVGYKTDLSPGVESIPFNKSGKGDWGLFLWSNQNWGGGFAAIPLRTYIPRQKQRCRFIQAQFEHNSAREKWAITGISYTLRGVSEKAYKGN